MFRNIAGYSWELPFEITLDALAESEDSEGALEVKTIRREDDRKERRSVIIEKRTDSVLKFKNHGIGCGGGFLYFGGIGLMWMRGVEWFELVVIFVGWLECVYEFVGGEDCMRLEKAEWWSGMVDWDEEIDVKITRSIRFNSLMNFVSRKVTSQSMGLLLVPLECAMVSGPKGTLSATKPIIKERVKVAINLEYPEQTVMIGSTFTKESRNKLCGLLQCNLDIFAWRPADMTGVPRHIAEHRLNVREGCSPVRQKKRGQAADRNQAIQEEVGKLVKAGIMKEVNYHD
ncbi:hypothetical protein Tco_1312229 [Tanacetum coccineum]